MIRDDDAFGHALLDLLHGDSVQLVIERDDGYVDVSDTPQAYFRAYREWPPHVKQAMRYARGRVLDVGCGAGRHSLYLQEKGLDVIGIDASPLAVRVCRRRGLERVHHLRATQIPAGLGPFDTILMLGNNLGLVENATRGKWLLRRFHRLTSDRARIIAETLDPRKTTNPAHLKYQRLNRKRGKLPGQVRLRIRYLTYATDWFDYLFVSPKELASIVSGTGWRIARVLGSEGPGYVAILEKN